MPRVSILLPVRDALPWLPACLASLRRQTLPDFEIVAVDDGSSDGSGEWLERASHSERRLKVVRAPALGLPAALNRALETARSPIVARQDADDLSHRRRLELQVDALASGRQRRAPGPDVVGSRVRLFPPAKVGAGMRRWAAWHNALLSHEEMAREVLIESPLAHGSAVFRREALDSVGGWAERGWAEDVDLWLRLLERGARFAKRREALYAWRQHEKSATRLDPRYSRARFLALKLEALGRGLLAGKRAVTVIGVGNSLERWTLALRGAGHAVQDVSAPRPAPSLLGRLERLEPPFLLVFGAVPARERWRKALEERRLTELVDFQFVG
ncbi:MAG: glycosyltransferase family 2 protein [Candidatus Eiseniibacteriota bacterium]